MWPRRKKRKKNNPKNCGHYVPAATPKGSALTFLGPKSSWWRVYLCSSTGPSKVCVLYMCTSVVQKYLTFDFQNTWLLIPFDSIKGATKNKFQVPRIMLKGPSRAILFCKKYKGFSKFIKETNFQPAFQYLYFKTIDQPKSDQRVQFLWSRRFFRHQDRPNWLMLYIWCLMCHLS